MEVGLVARRSRRSMDVAWSYSDAASIRLLRPSPVDIDIWIAGLD
jgi:hypothetical protein